MSMPSPDGTLAAVLLDRDGTVIVDKNYLSDPAGVELLPGAAEGLRSLAAAGLRLFVVTNQSGIGRGYFSEAAYHACHTAMETLLRGADVPLEGGAFCPHAPEDACECRKPALGMWRLLAARHALDASRTAMVGDKAEDAAFGRNAGFAAVVLVLTGKGGEAARKLGLPVPEGREAFRRVDEAFLPGGERLPHVVARDLRGAARYILRAEHFHFEKVSMP